MKPQARRVRPTTIGKTPSRLTGAVCSVILGWLLLVPACGAAATMTIYRCLDKNLGLLYTDEPCKEGAAMDIRAGDADPAAVARLEREREALTQSATQRINDERRNAAQRELAALYARPADTDPGSSNATDLYADGTVYGYPAFVGRHPARLHPRKPATPQRVALEPHKIDTMR